MDLNTIKPETGQNPLVPGLHNRTTVSGQVSTRTTLLLTEHDKENKRFSAVGGISDLNFQVGSQVIPLQELGSDRIIIADGRPQPFRMSVTKNFLNGRSLIPSLYAADKFNSNFVVNIHKPVLKKPIRLAAATWNGDVTNISTGRILEGILIENYSLSVDADRVVIMEQLSLVGENVIDESPITNRTVTKNANGDLEYKDDADGTTLRNAADFNTVAEEGSITAMSVILAACPKPTRGGVKTYSPIGGIRAFNLTLSNQIEPSTEVGSDKNYLVVGRPVPTNINLEKVFINKANLLKSLIHTLDETEVTGSSTDPEKNVEFELNISQKILNKPNDYAILVYLRKDGTDELKYVIPINQARIQNYAFGAGGGVVLRENVSMIGEIGEEISK